MPAFFLDVPKQGLQPVAARGLAKERERAHQMLKTFDGI